ncbi:MAG: hypothetical protein AAF184_21875 [Pseudomonadota bacterium]
MSLLLGAPVALGDAAVDALRSDYYTDVFEAVSTSIAYEPYSGAQRGPAQTARSGAGNALDQSVLLIEALGDSVHAARIAVGRLRDPALVQLLGATSPHLPSHLGIDHPGAYDPINDDVTQKIARDHALVEVQLDEGDDWLALDPSFPHAEPGDSFATATRHYDRLPDASHQRLTITWMQTTADGRQQRLGRIQGTVAELATAPISLVVRAIPQFAPLASEESPPASEGLISGTPGSLLGGGGLGGSTRPTAPPDEPASETGAEPVTDEDRAVVGLEYRREASYAGQAPKALAPTPVVFDDAGSHLTREWLAIELRVPGQPVRRLTRDLFVAQDASDRPPAVRRYSVAVIAGTISREAFEAQRSLLTADAVATAQAELTTLQGETDDDAAALRLMQLEASQAVTPHLINLAFASESDTLSARLARRAGVRLVHDVPRIVITSAHTDVDEASSVDAELTLDLRLDELRALPLGGMPRGAAALFQRARGMQESALEGRVLARFVEDPKQVITTARLMDIAQREGQELLLLTADDPSAAATLARLTPTVRDRVERTLQREHQVIIPASPVAIDGTAMWGWWDVDPATGAFVGVMESGQHQAMAQYSVTLEKVGVNDAMGYVLGALTGSTATMTLYSAKMLEYGQVTPQLIAEVAAGIERLTCVTCPSFEVVVSPISASASFESPCFEQTGVGIGTGGGVSGSISFCENYKLGISCAASLMLGTFEVEGDVDIGPNIDLDLGPLSCE